MTRNAGSSEEDRHRHGELKNIPVFLILDKNVGKAKCLIGVIFDSVGMNHLVGFFKIFITKNYLERTGHIF